MNVYLSGFSNALNALQCLFYCATIYSLLNIYKLVKFLYQIYL